MNSSEIEFKKNLPKLKFIKNEKLEVLLPLSIIQKNQLNSVSLVTDVPVFFIPKSERFAFFLPNGFSQDFKKKEITNKSKVFEKLEWVEGSHEENYVGFSAPSIKELRQMAQSSESLYSLFKQEYEKHLINIQNGEPVIFLIFENQERKELFQRSNSNNNLNEKSSALIESSFSLIEFFKAVKFDQHYYFFDQEGNVDQNQSFTFDKNKYKEMNILILPYTDEDWNIVTKINDRFLNLIDGIETLFEETKQLGVLDKHLGDHILALEDKSSKKIKP